MKKGALFTLAALLIFSSGFIARMIFFSDKNTPSSCDNDYEFINTQFGCQTNQIVAKHGYADLVSKIRTFITKKEEEGIADMVSVYFRDLKNGPTFGINESDRFAPASLLKVPIMLVYFSLSEDDPSILEREITISDAAGEVFNSQVFPPSDEVVPGNRYKADELIYMMIVNSDNKAADALVSELIAMGHQDILAQTYREMGLVMIGFDTELNISVRSYASIFRMLYNPSYLSNELSEKALSYLEEAKFHEGLSGGVPGGVIVASKFGERFDAGVEGEMEQFHDCGIIYYPKNPYLLCVMTKGESVIELSELTSEISRMVYEEFDARKLN